MENIQNENSANSLKVDKYIVCKSCGTKLAQYDSLFAMSKEGVQTSYCNSGKAQNHLKSLFFSLIESSYF